MDEKVTKSWGSAFGVFQMGRNDKVPQIKYLETVISERYFLELYQMTESK